MDDSTMYKGSRLLREYTLTFHLMSMFFGLVVTSIGAYLINSDISKTVSISLLVLGGLVTTTSFIGCFGAQLENTGFLNTFSSITAITLIIELIMMGLAYSHQSQLDYYASIIWDMFQQRDEKFLLDIERTSLCCGYASTTDRAVPPDCSILLGANTGCKESIIFQIQQYHRWIIVGLIALISVQFVLMLLSIILSFLMENEARKEETYMTLLTNNHTTSWVYPPSSPNYSNSNSSDANNHTSYFARHSRSSQKSIPKYGSTSSR